MRITDIYPHESWRQPKPTWRSRWPKETDGEPAPVPERSPAMQALTTRFTTTPDWEGVSAAQQSAHNLFKSRRST
jgi:hypothetical protein